MARRFPPQVAEERLEKIVAMAARAGRNVLWLSRDAFTLRSWEPHVRFRARYVDGAYVLEEQL
ncbi:hypothetical protein [Pyrobaculum neutrophilum]|uniref:Uncharacterized protein n=1 Tax=Pyrobaculum neutrophilum (strain DSM 2338 / JCM 9278 / NBRC 100436 / V24Sta) TaxID=444157 RepID=B1YBZ9_PYRNV|nr:hypothetical protein [Pyrobaculum neutrophilum]ACB39383.1 conserved hypothetical protein [Pyrobaculum neutrophilum V24Sta]